MEIEKNTQCIIFSKECFPNRKYIKRWFEKRKIELPKSKNPIKSFDDVFRVRLKNPNKFIRSTYHEEWINPYVCMVLGEIKDEK